MTEDLLTNVRQQLEERIEELRDAVEERDRLQANLRALEAEPWVLDAGLACQPSADAEPEVPGPAPEAQDAGPTAPHAGQDDAALEALDTALATPDAGQDDAAPEGPDVEPAEPVTAEAGPATMISGQQTLDVELGMLAADPGPQDADLSPLDADPNPPANVVRLPARPEPEPAPAPEPTALESEPAPAPAPAPAAPAPTVSPKIARLMSAPRRPALERSGIARVGGRADASPRRRVDEDEPPDEIYEQAI
jgi:hypothetical protein